MVWEGQQCSLALPASLSGCALSEYASLNLVDKGYRQDNRQCLSGWETEENLLSIGFVPAAKRMRFAVQLAAGMISIQ
jgi:hypothetical protein